MKPKPIRIDQVGDSYTVHVSPARGDPFVPVERLIDGRYTYGRINAKPELMSYRQAETLAHQIGRYKLGLSDFIDTYVDGLKEEG